jgi:hypothetical protein
MGEQLQLVSSVEHKVEQLLSVLLESILTSLVESRKEISIDTLRVLIYSHRILRIIIH